MKPKEPASAGQSTRTFFPLSAKLGNTKIKLELADTLEERIKGLSGRKELPDNEGLLFVYDEPGFYGIWMKDMNFPIDIIWIGEDKRVIWIKESAEPESFPETFSPSEPAKYVLEVNAGFAETHGVKIGDSADFDI